MTRKYVEKQQFTTEASINSSHLDSPAYSISQSTIGSKFYICQSEIPHVSRLDDVANILSPGAGNYVNDMTSLPQNLESVTTYSEPHETIIAPENNNLLTARKKIISNYVNMFALTPIVLNDSMKSIYAPSNLQEGNIITKLAIAAGLGLAYKVIAVPLFRYYSRINKMRKDSAFLAEVKSDIDKLTPILKQIVKDYEEALPEAIAQSEKERKAIFGSAHNPPTIGPFSGRLTQEQIDEIKELLKK